MGQGGLEEIVHQPGRAVGGRLFPLLQVQKLGRHRRRGRCYRCLVGAFRGFVVGVWGLSLQELAGRGRGRRCQGGVASTDGKVAPGEAKGIRLHAFSFWGFLFLGCFFAFVHIARWFDAYNFHTSTSRKRLRCSCSQAPGKRQLTVEHPYDNLRRKGCDGDE